MWSCLSFRDMALSGARAKPKGAVYFVILSSRRRFRLAVNLGQGPPARPLSRIGSGALLWFGTAVPHKISISILHHAAHGPRVALPRHIPTPNQYRDVSADSKLRPRRYLLLYSPVRRASESLEHHMSLRLSLPAPCTGLRPCRCRCRTGRGARLEIHGQVGWEEEEDPTRAQRILWGDLGCIREKMVAGHGFRCG